MVTADTTVTFSNTGTAILKAAAFSGIREYMFINQDAADNLLISDGSTTFTVKPNTMIYATQSGTYDPGGRGAMLVSANFGRLVLGCIEADVYN